MLGCLNRPTHAQEIEETAARAYIAMRGRADRKHAGEHIIPSRDSMSVTNCQAVGRGITTILRRQLLVRFLDAQTAHITQSAGPNQSATALRAPIVFTRKSLDALKRQTKIR